MPAAYVHLVRHGQSTWNVEGRVQGQTAHPPLTALGRDQAERAADAVAARVTDGQAEVWSSDLVRARETAAVVAERLGGPVRVSAALREQALGTMEGRLAAELTEQQTPAGRHVTEVRWAGGESIADVHTRVGAFLAARLATSPAHLVLVTHGDTIRVALAWLAGAGHRDVTWDVVPNGSVTTVEVAGCSPASFRARGRAR